MTTKEAVEYFEHRASSDQSCLVSAGSFTQLTRWVRLASKVLADVTNGNVDRDSKITARELLHELELP